jgi:hypothetical protein
MERPDARLGRARQNSGTAATVTRLAELAAAALQDQAMDAEFYRARAAEATRKAQADLFNSHIYREIASCYERLAAESDHYSAGGQHREARPPLRRTSQCGSPGELQGLDGGADFARGARELSECRIVLRNAVMEKPAR